MGLVKEQHRVAAGDFYVLFCGWKSNRAARAFVPRQCYPSPCLAKEALGSAKASGSAYVFPSLVTDQEVCGGASRLGLCGRKPASVPPSIAFGVLRICASRFQSPPRRKQVRLQATGKTRRSNILRALKLISDHTVNPSTWNNLLFMHNRTRSLAFHGRSSLIPCESYTLL